MGQLIKIINLAENIIRLSGVQGITIQKIGLCRVKKLYEELLVETGKLDKTDNSMIFIERDTPPSAEEIQQKLEMLKDACDTGDELVAKETLRKVVPTLKKTEEVNKEVASLEEKKERKKTGIKVAML